MIGRLTGLLAEKNPPELLLDCGGVGYDVSVPMSTFYNLPALGEKLTLLTHFVVREDAQILYGFATAAERAAFRQLIKISGVGPRTALSVLSGMSVDDLAQAITAQDPGRIIKVPGIGKNRRAPAARTQGQARRRHGRTDVGGQRRAVRHQPSAGRPRLQRPRRGSGAQGVAQGYWGV